VGPTAESGRSLRARLLRKRERKAQATRSTRFRRRRPSPGPPAPAQVQLYAPPRLKSTVVCSGAHASPCPLGTISPSSSPIAGAIATYAAPHSPPVTSRQVHFPCQLSTFDCQHPRLLPMKFIRLRPNTWAEPRPTPHRPRRTHQRPRDFFLQSGFRCSQFFNGVSQMGSGALHGALREAIPSAPSRKRPPPRRRQ